MYLLNIKSSKNIQNSCVYVYYLITINQISTNNVRCRQVKRKARGMIKVLKNDNQEEKFDMKFM